MRLHRWVVWAPGPEVKSMPLLVVKVREPQPRILVLRVVVVAARPALRDRTEVWMAPEVHRPANQDHQQTRPQAAAAHRTHLICGG
jgi:hypothetical protein